MHSSEEKAAASAVASLGENKLKRNADMVDDGSDNSRPSKAAKTVVVSSDEETEAHTTKPKASMKPAPFYCYKDFSQEPDDDPLAPLTPPGRVPNFPAKMHAILSRPDLSDIVAWMPHGRSWRVLKPREFEVRVIPTYFEHSKFSSFIRQANGWGFRRITQGVDRNSYYNELFLRGLPHLCKKMKRPGVAEKAAADPEHEPDFYKISQMFPVPEKAADDESIMLHCTLQGGPKARMPVYSRPIRSNSVGQDPSTTPILTRDQSLLPSVTPNSSVQMPKSREQVLPLSQKVMPESYSKLPVSPVQPAASLALSDQLSPADRLAFAMQRPQLTSVAQAAAIEASTASADFAAGFAAAAALNSNHLRTVLGQALAASSSPFLAPPTASPRNQFGLPSNTMFSKLR